MEQQCLELQRELDDVHTVVTRADTRTRQEENRNRLLVQEVEMLKRHLVSVSGFGRLDAGLIVLLVTSFAGELFDGRSSQQCRKL